MRIRSILEAAFSATCVLALAGSAQAMPSQLGYSGRLYDARANAITGSADFKVTLYSGGSAVGAAQEFSDTQVVDGSFTVLLDATDELVAILSDPAADTVVLSAPTSSWCRRSRSCLRHGPSQARPRLMAASPTS